VIRNEILLRTDNKGRTTWHPAAYSGKQVAMLKIWDWAKEKLTTDEIRNEMLLHTDNEGWTAWNFATYSGEQVAMQKILYWAKQKLTTRR
jgi:SRSO17 transposase